MHGFLRGGYLSEVANHSQRIFTLILNDKFSIFLGVMESLKKVMFLVVRPLRERDGGG